MGTMTRPTVDIGIVGAGPAGLYAAVFAGFRGMAALVIDALPVAGGQVAALFAEKDIYDVAAIPRIRGRDLVDALMRQAANFDTPFLLGTTLTTVEDVADGLELTTSDGLVVTCRALVIAGGLGHFRPRELPGGERFLGRGLSYHVEDPADYRGSSVVIFGGGDSAVDWALAVAPYARETHLVHRRRSFRAHAHSVEQLAPAGVRLHLERRLGKINGYDEIEAVDLITPDGRPAESIETDRVVGALGFRSDLGPILDWGMRIDAHRIVVDSTMATSRPRVFAVGDIATYPGKVRLLSVGFGEAATAINNAAPLVDPELAVAPGHSSDAPPPGIAATS